MYIVWQQIDKNEWRLNAKNADKTKALKAYAGCVKSVGVNKCKFTEEIKPDLKIGATVAEEEVEETPAMAYANTPEGYYPAQYMLTKNYGAGCKIKGKGVELTKLPSNGAWVPCVDGSHIDGEIHKTVDKDGYLTIKVY